MTNRRHSRALKSRDISEVFVAQMEERELWNNYEQKAMEKAKTAGCEIVEIADKTPFQNAVKPVWDKYGPKYQDMIKRIQEVA